MSDSLEHKPIKYLGVEIPQGYERVARIYLEYSMLSHDPTGTFGLLTNTMFSSTIDQLKTAEFMSPQKHDTTTFEFQAFVYSLRAESLKQLGELQKKMQEEDEDNNS